MFDLAGVIRTQYSGSGRSGKRINEAEHVNPGERH